MATRCCGVKLGAIFSKSATVNVPAAFFKLTRAYVTMVGKDKQNYGHVPIEYIDNKQ